MADVHEVTQAMAKMIRAGLKEKNFSTGSKGFFASDKIVFTDADEVPIERYQFQAQAVLVGSKEHPRIKVKPTVDQIAEHMVGLMPIEPPMTERTFSSGKHGYRVQGKIEIDDQRFQASVQAVRLLT